MIWIKAKDEYVWDEQEIKYIDFTSGGIFTCAAGNANARVIKAIREVQFTACYQHNNFYREKYLEMLADFTGYESAALFSAGTEATEAAWRIMRRFKGKDGIAGLAGAFHGMTLGALIMAGAVNDWRYGMPLEKTCGIIIEPYTALTAEFHNEKMINRIISCREEFNLMLCADEIQGGFGRTGRLFGYEHYSSPSAAGDSPSAAGDSRAGRAGIKPDLVCIGKACGSGLPLSAVLGCKELIEESAMDLHSTHGGNPLACAAGIATIEEFIEKDLINRAGQLGANILEPWVDTLSVEAYGRGMIAGIIFQDRKTCLKVINLCEKRGLLVVDTRENTIKIGPPLIIGEPILNKGLAILKESIEEVLNDKASACGD